ncbi:GNAT family N-acetyltransferase [Bacillus coahuilensis]|uniref:GNAT family N-acetyltransferase n=1 Tax=Bacillus coahuilensis TaxID=408580 RepID=UPI0001850C4D|nr:GNAT family N-acetyltransferase [Bacillus coahuilensis]
MKTTLHTIHDFKETAYDWLVKEESINNLLLGLIHRIIDENRYPDVVCLTVKSEESLKAAAIMTPPHNLVVGIRSDEEDLDKIGESLFNFLIEQNIEFPGIIGVKQSTVQLAEIWTNKTGDTFKIGMDQGIYECREVVNRKFSEGYVAVAGEKYINLLSDWMIAFCKESRIPMVTKEEAVTRMRDSVQSKSMYVWFVEGKPVSMAMRGRKSKNGETVSLVYTPVEFRKNGYGSSVVAEVSKRILAERELCNLYTDITNPTSNKIYQEIGYNFLCKSIMLEKDKVSS